MRKILLLIAFLCLSSNAWATDWSSHASAELILPMDEGSGTDVDDKSSNATTCTYNGAWGSTSMPKAYMDSYLDLDGSNDYVTCGNAAGTDFVEDATDFTVTFWVITYVEGNTYERYFTRESNGGDVGWMIARNVGGADGLDGTIFIIERSLGDQDGISFHTTDNTYLADDSHYAVAYDWSEDKASTYINGVNFRNAASVSSTYNFGWSSTTDTLCIGARCTDASTQAESHINEAGLFSAMLDSTDVNDIMDNGLVQAATTRRLIF